MIMKLTKYLCIALLALTGAACSSDGLQPEVPAEKGDIYVEGDKVVVSVGIQMPEMPNADSRTLGPEADYADMHLYLLEFVDNGSPLRNTFTTMYEAEAETPQPGKVVYKVTLNKTSEGRVLHLVALPKSQKLTPDYGVEASVMPNIVVTDQTPAYWRRLAFPEGYATVSESTGFTATEAMEQLKSVALVRNFGRVTVTKDPSVTDFILTGFALVNNPQSGTVAPWDASDNEFPEFLDADQKPVAFSALSSYEGIIPAGTEFDNQDAGPAVPEDVNPKYFYERPFSSIRHTFVIVRGKYKTDETDSYYKLDLGKNDTQGVFRYYNLLRNFSYNITIKGVGTRGYSTAEEAAQGVVYNNFSFDIELGGMLNISDGNEVVFVNFTTAVLTDPNTQVLEFKYRYRSLAGSSQGAPTYNNGNVNFIGLEPGDVIQSVEKSTTDDSDGWRSVKITCKGATAETKTQSFTMVKESGLGRTINLVLRQKWDFMNLKEFPGTGQNYVGTGEALGTGATKLDLDNPNRAGDGEKDPITVFFDIPDNLPEAMFPLVFELEADRQNIENNPIGTLVVTSGTSSFPNIQGSRIKYIKTITWTQYNDPLLPGQTHGANGLKIDNGNGTSTRRVRCRFRTITSLNNLGIQGSVTTIRITNDHYNTGEIKFTRGNGTLN